MTRARRIGLILFAGLATVVFVGLGVWQVQRRAWKLDLVARVEARLAAPPAAAPGPGAWPDVTADGDAYRRLVLSGTFVPGHDTLVQAVTELGPGSWVLTPLTTDDGFTVLVNRGFVPPERRAPEDHVAPADHVTVTGLLRLTEPDGAFLRANDPAAGRWYSRDTAAIAAAQGLGPVAPFFVDQGHGAAGVYPVGGLTVVRFHNSHLVYALTWFAMALTTLVGTVLALRHGRRAGTRAATPAPAGAATHLG
ncbi:SURF1 family protein [Acuticoccus sp. I52.16.1]|uniref:SURF1 family protein n=1 Tax=Acuticoccus sp. I52.16.1 TaxID=2928472 RepID=UPI001FD2EF10|nr:SURF1 family protein [Acuticoccus sp. I52.16.1]UOM35347.1 SURF1 family protein [Acuticoccus sp. I52.16.1]